MPAVPRIDSQGTSSARPFWSVMVPTYNPRARYLEQTLRSVLQQDPGPEQMQIEVVDDCSPAGPLVECVRHVAADRIRVHCEPKNRGLAGTWNRCIERARGEWVHILHQDDVVLPGFYERLALAAQAAPPVGAAFCRQAFMDEDGHWFHLTELERREPGVLDNFLERIAVRQRIETASIVVRRSVYECLGGFLPQLCYALDWEMWRRIAARYPVWYEPGILACYRLHPHSETARVAKAGRQMQDVRDSIRIAEAYLPSQKAADLSRQARRQYALATLDEVSKHIHARNFAEARALQRECLKLSCDRAVVRKVLRLSYWQLRKQLGLFRGGEEGGRNQVALDSEGRAATGG
jgi:glycosyltransferase involved in cell wall biosynthesis